MEVLCLWLVDQRHLSMASWPAEGRGGGLTFAGLIAHNVVGDSDG
jgi:hypothetical protein